MLIHIFLFLIITLLILVLLAPSFLKSRLRESFPTVQMTLFSPFSLRGIMLNGPTGSWGLDRLTIFISSIELGFSLKKFRFSLNLTNFQIFCTRRAISLMPVNLIDGFQEPNILFNFINFISCDGFRHENKKTGAKESRIHQTKTTFKFFAQGILHLTLLLMMHTVEVNLIDFKGFIVSSVPESLVSFEDIQKRKNSLMLMQCLAQYSLSCEVVTVKARIQKHDSYQLDFKCNRIVGNSYLHWKNTFLEVKDIRLQITIPFSLSIEKSFQEMNYKIWIEEGLMNLIPGDFDHFFQLIKELFFNPYRAKPDPLDNHQSKHQMEIYINLIKLQMEDIYEVEYDNQETKEYLSNVSNATVTLEKISQDQTCFSVAMGTLSLQKYYRQQSLSRRVDVLTVPNLTITSIPDSGLSQITHDQIMIQCRSEEVAFLGKIFSIINSRIRFENYNEDIYKNLIENYTQGSTLISEMERICDGDGQALDSEEREVTAKKKSTVLYTPKKIGLYIQMVKLKHVISIEGFSYSRFYGFNEMSHELVINRFIVQHRQLREFIVTDFRLTFSLTTNQDHLTMMIQDITMNQNLQTLIDYLDSFTLFKHLLQFESDEGQKTSKFTKKNISIYQITLNFSRQIISLRALQIAKESHLKEMMNSIYFSLQNCSILLTKLKPEKRILKPFVSRDRTILSFSSLSIRQGYEVRNNKAKKKVNFVLKDPSICLPEVDISQRLRQYYQMFGKMDVHIQAYLRNVSNSKLQYLKYHLRDFLEEPPILCIILTKISLSIADNKLNNTILGFSRTIREELSLLHKYNQAQILSILRRNNKVTYLLLDIEIQKLRVELSPIKHLESSEKSVEEWISQFPDTKVAKDQQKHRIKHVQAGNLQIKLKNICVKVRDYTLPIVKISMIHFQGSMMNVKRIFGQKENFVKGQLLLNEAQLNVGLGQLSGLNQIRKKIKQFSILDKSGSKRQLTLKQKRTFLHQILQEWNWDISFKKESATYIHLLTGCNPYETEKFDILIGTIVATSQYERTDLRLQSFEIRLRDFQIVMFPRMQLKFKVFLYQGQFGFDILASITEEAAVNMSRQLFSYIQQLGQLRKDWLLIYGIYQRKIGKKEIEVRDIQNMNYLQIANLLVEQTANTQGKKSVLNLVNQIKCVGNFNSFKVSLIQEDLELSIMVVKASTFLMIKPNHDLYNRYEIIRSNIAAEKLLALFTKENTMGETIMHSRVPTELIEHFKKKEGIIYPFLACYRIGVNFNWYFQQEGVTGRSNVLVSVDQVQGEISKKIERYCLKIFQTFDQSRLSVRPETVAPKFKPLSKFRKAVLEIILINRRNKIKRGHVKKFKLVINFDNCRLALKHYDKQMSFVSNRRVSFYQSCQFSDTDMYHARPQEQIMLIFPQSSIQIKDVARSQDFRQIMDIGALKIELHTAKPHQNCDFINWGSCQFSNIKVTLNSQTKNFMDEFMEFILSIVNTSDEKKRIYRQDMQKYSQFVNKRPQRLKERILWSQSDLKENEKEIFRWSFVFRSLQAYLQNENGRFISALIDSTKIAMNLFNNTKIDRKIILKKFTIKNELEGEESSFRNIVQMGQEGASLTVIMQTFDVPAFSEVRWKFFKEISIEIEPARVKMTEDLVNCIHSFFEKAEEDDSEFRNDLEEYRNKTPDYIKLLTIEPMVFQLWFQSPSVFKRMEGIKVSLSRYQLKDKLYTQKQMRLAWTVWLLKQLASQALWVLQQKLFGDREEQNK